MVNVGGESPDEAFWLSFGDVVALSGDFFRPAAWPTASPEPGQEGPSEAAAGGGLFSLARVPGGGGIRLDTRDEIVCALKVASLDEAVPDARFLPGGRS